MRTASDLFMFNYRLNSFSFVLKLTLVGNELSCVVFKANHPTTNLKYIVGVDTSYTALRLSVKPPLGQGLF